MKVNDVEIAVETFGDQGDEPILLIGGAAASMDWWEDDFVRQLADGGRFVIRYDNRDTGQSTSYEAGKPAYSGVDLLSDAVGLLDGLGLSSAHLVGISMGGGIAQHIAVKHPDRVKSLTLMSTSPDGPGGPSHPDLPPMADRLKAMFAKPTASPDWTDRAAVLEFFVAGEKAFAGELPVDEDRIREIAGRAFDRTIDVEASQTNHWILEGGGEPVRHRLSEIAVPVLVLHGTHDPLVPFGHGEALAREIPGARLVALDGVGHQMPPPEVWGVVIPEILRLTASAGPN